MEQENKEIEQCRKRKDSFEPTHFSNGETRKELLGKSRFLLFPMPSQLTENQKERTRIFFKEYSKLRITHRLTIKFR